MFLYLYTYKPISDISIQTNAHLGVELLPSLFQRNTETQTFHLVLKRRDDNVSETAL